MKKRTWAIAALCFCGLRTMAQSDSVKTQYELAPTIVESTKADAGTPVAFTNLVKKDLDKLNLGQDLPYLIRFTPSLVATSDAGNGIGYTGLWIRGSDPSRINVTVNGIPLNDPESQQVFWVNMPDFASGTTRVQIQRGAGTSTNGAGAFGGTIKLETTGVSEKPYAEIINAGGSFGALRNTIRFGTGWLGNNWAFDGRVSHIRSNGYVDRASANLKSAFFAANYQKNRTSLRFTGFTGMERTYQAWYGTPAARLSGNADSLNTFIANNYLSTEDANNLLNSDRRYNFYTYPNQVDNYAQHHAQAHLTQGLNEKGTILFNAALHYTRGEGYFEEYRASQSLARYGLNPITLATASLGATGVDENGGLVNSFFANQFLNPDVNVWFAPVLSAEGDTLLDPNGAPLLSANAELGTSHIVRRRWLRNDFYGGIFSFKGNSGRFDWVVGGAANEYRGEHFGQLIWSQYAGVVPKDYRYYEGRSKKQDANVYAKSSIRLNAKWSAYVDLQMRHVNYTTAGVDNDLMSYDVDAKFNFFNPKAGINYQSEKGLRTYASVAVANKEPNRNDFIDAPEGKTPRPENLTDIEAGAEYKWVKVNAYYMMYKDQLVLTGAVNDVGAPLRSNVDRSYRMGLETEFFGTWKAFEWNLNATVSRNKIEAFTEVIPDYLNGGNIEVKHSQTDIAFSPSLIAGGMLTYHAIPVKVSGNESNVYLNFTWLTRYVSKQYLDNTQNDFRSIPSYWVNDVRAETGKRFSSGREVAFQVMLNNALSTLYSSNGYTYTYAFGDVYNERFFYPQATRNVMAQLVLKF
jgi:iron complex outermembrane receptor protein